MEYVIKIEINGEYKEIHRNKSKILILEIYEQYIKTKRKIKNKNKIILIEERVILND